VTTMVVKAWESESPHTDPLET
jgi:hypothetical protein